MNTLCCLSAVFSKAKHTQVSTEDVAESERLASNPNKYQGDYPRQKKRDGKTSLCSVSRGKTK